MHVDNRFTLSSSERESYSWLHDESPPAPAMPDDNDVVVNDVVSINGLEAMLCSFLGGIGEYSRGNIKELFNNTDESGYIKKDEFHHFLDLATGDEANS